MVVVDNGNGDSIVKSIIGGMLFGPIGLIGGVLLGRKKIVCTCHNYGLIKEYSKDSDTANVVKQLL